MFENCCAGYDKGCYIRCTKLIKKCKSKLIVSIALGKDNDLLDIVHLVHTINPDYALAIRYRMLMPTQLWFYAF